MFSQYVKELYNSSFHFQDTEPAFLSIFRLYELNVDIIRTRTVFYAPPHILSFQNLKNLFLCLLFYLNLAIAFLTPPLRGGWVGLCGE